MDMIDEDVIEYLLTSFTDSEQPIDSMVESLLVSKNKFMSAAFCPRQVYIRYQFEKGLIGQPKKDIKIARKGVEGSVEHLRRGYGTGGEPTIKDKRFIVRFKTGLIKTITLMKKGLEGIYERDWGDLLVMSKDFCFGLVDGLIKEGDFYVPYELKLKYHPRYDMEVAFLCRCLADMQGTYINHGYIETTKRSLRKVILNDDLRLKIEDIINLCREIKVGKYTPPRRKTKECKRCKYFPECFPPATTLLDFIW